MKKIVAILAICVAITIMLPVNGMLENHSSPKEEKTLPTNLVTPIPIRTIPIPKATEGKEVPLTLKHMCLPADIPATSTEDPEVHPTLAMDGSGNIFGAYITQTSILEASLSYIFSEDGGTTWEYIRTLNYEGMPEYPAIDYWGSGTTFVGTFRPDPTDCDGSAQYVLRVDDPTDPETWSLLGWDWSSYNQRDRESPDIAGYSNVGDATWWYGVIAETGSSDYTDSEGEHIPVFNFPSYTDENSGWIWWWNGFENAAHACIDIDRSNGMMYAAWDQFNESRAEQGRDILLAIADVHDWWVENWVINWSYLGGPEANTYPDIAAENGYIYIACQADIMIPGKQDIMCFYSHDGGTTWETSNIAADPAKDEMYPSIVAYGEGATCTFVIDGDLYVSHTADGGVTWSTPEKVNDETGTISMEYRTAKVTNAGHALWTDTRNGNADIYYDNVGFPPTPILSVGDISGGFGVKATVANIGTADAENVEWDIVFDGPVFVGKEKSGTVTIPAGGEATISSGLILGIGPASITITVGGATKTASGFVLGPLVLGIK